MVARVQSSVPRPVRHVYMYTETVATTSSTEAAGDEGEEERRIPFYLDTKNADHNFWGSSIYATHADVVAAAGSGAPGTEPQSVWVRGKTLTALVRETTRRHFGNHLLIKLDIEGAEYAVLNEAFDAGILCQYAESAVRVDIIVEMHKQVGRERVGREWSVFVWLELTFSGSSFDKKVAIDGNDGEAYERFMGEVRRGFYKCGVSILTVKDAGR